VKPDESEQAEMGRLKLFIRHKMPPVAQWDPIKTCCWIIEVIKKRAG